MKTFYNNYKTNKWKYLPLALHGNGWNYKCNLGTFVYKERRRTTMFENSEKLAENKQHFT